MVVGIEPQKNKKIKNSINPFCSFGLYHGVPDQ
jgi:hypothetical protein